MSQCPVCEKKFETKLGARLHCAYKHKDVFRQHFPEPEYYHPEHKYDEATMQELAEISDKNLLRMLGGNLRSLTAGQRKTLRRQGLVTKPGRRQKLEFSEKALRILEELKNE